MRRHPDFHHPLPNNNYGSLAATAIGMLLGIVVVGIFLGFMLAFFSASARAHESWISNGGFKNPAGEWCCGASDCGIVNGSAISAVTGGYSVRGLVTYGMEATGNAADGPTWTEPVNELVPYNQTLPSPDGAYWRCKRPDGSNRCFFAPQPSM